MFQAPQPAVEKFLPRLREEGAEIIVALSHLGLGGDVQLARSVRGIDVIVGGHSQNCMKSAEKVGDTLIVQAGAHGSDLGRLDLTLGRGKNNQEAFRHGALIKEHASQYETIERAFRQDSPMSAPPSGRIELESDSK